MSTAEDVRDAIHVGLRVRAEAKVGSRPRNQPIASDIEPGSCRRRQVLEIVRWQDKRPIPANRMGRLEAGDDAEKKGIRLLGEIGLRVIKEQVLFEFLDRKTRRPVLRGRIDCFIEVPLRGERPEEVPVEIKSLPPWAFSTIHTLADLQRFWWMRRYVPQMIAYLIGYGLPAGILLLTNMMGDWLALVVELDYDLAEQVLALAEGIEADVAAWRAAPEGETPPLPDYTPDVAQCPRCDFFGAACNPPLEERGASMEPDPELESLLAQREKVEQAHRDFAWFDKEAKAILKHGPERRILGGFMVHRKPGRIEIIRIGPKDVPPAKEKP